MDDRPTRDGETVYVSRSEAETGSEGPFYRVYSDEDRTDVYGYLCSNCDTLDNAMDTMGRLVCNSCGNTRKPEEWDSVTGG